MQKLLLTSFLAALGAVSNVIAQFGPPPAPGKPAAPPPAPTTPAKAPGKPDAPAPAAAPENPNNPVSPAAPGDPFVRNPRAPKGAPPAPAAPPAFHMLVFETYALPTSELAAIFAQETSDAGRHRLIVALHAAGKARLTELFANTTRDQIRSALNSFDEVRYWTEFGEAAAPGEAPSPGAAEVQNAGVGLESELTLGPDGQHGQLDFSLSRRAFQGLREYSNQPGDPPVTAPIFSSRKLSASGSLRIGEPALLGSTSDPREEGAGLESWITFATATPVKIEPPARAAQAPLSHANLEVSFYSLDRALARQILAEAAAPGDIHRRVAALAAEGKSQLERLMVCPAVSGQRNVNEQGIEFRYPTEFDPGGGASTGDSTHRSATTTTKRFAANGTNPRETESIETTENTSHSVPDPKAPHLPGHPTAFEIRDVGIYLETEPVIDETGSGEAALELREVRNLGTLKVTGVAAKYPFQPLFEMRNTTQTVPLWRGEAVCIGTLNAPSENGVNGRKDDGRTVLVFVRLNGQP